MSREAALVVPELFPRSAPSYVRDLVGTRVLAVHAHPDDEAIWTGGTLAQLARRGAEVTVVTCTLGEEGEVIGNTWQGLVADKADQLGGFRIGELAASHRALGVRGRLLSGAGQWRDSGMVGSSAHRHPRAFVNSGPRAVGDLVEIFEELRPDVVITYGPDGGYGHPDHIRAHHVTHQAARRTTVPVVLWAVTVRAELERALAGIREIPDGWRNARAGELASVERADAVVVLSDADVAAKADAMRAHATQLWLADGSVSITNPRAAYAVSDPDVAPVVFCLSNRIAQPLMRYEYYQVGWRNPGRAGA